MPKDAAKNARLDAFVVAIASGRPVAAATRDASIGLRTGFKLLKRPDVLTRIAEVRDQLLDAAVARVAGMAGAAAKRLRRLLDSKDEKVVLHAVRSVLQLGIALRDHRELAVRLAALEAAERAREESDGD